MHYDPTEGRKIVMKIGIVTIYESVTNLGSYLQAYAMQAALQEIGHEVCFIEKEPVSKVVRRCVCKLNPKREFFLRFQKCAKYLHAKKLLRTIPQEDISKERIDCLIYGSDEIWNMDNPYFKDPLFWGTNQKGISRIAYAASVGAMDEMTLNSNRDIAHGICEFEAIFARDERTQDMIGRFTRKTLPIVCDPTFLVPVQCLQKPVKLPKEKYLLVYSYGVDQMTEELIVRFAKEHELAIISPCFWHVWCDRVIECEPLQFGTLVQNAEYVFTSTFHGAIFAMLNHKRCAILPARSKVRDVVERMGLKQHLISSETTYEAFSRVMEQKFPDEEFENRLMEFRAESKMKLEGALKCLEK